MEEKKIDLFESFNSVIFDVENGFIQQNLRSIVVSDDNNNYDIKNVYQLKSNKYAKINDYVYFLKNYDWKEKLYLRNNFYNSFGRYGVNQQQKEYTEINVSSISLVLDCFLWKSYSSLMNNSNGRTYGDCITIHNKKEVNGLFEKTYSAIDKQKIKSVSPSIYDVKFGDEFWLEGVGKVGIIKIYDYPNANGNVFSVICPDSSTKDILISDVVKLKYLPFNEIPEYKYSFFNKNKNELHLMPFLVYKENLYNLYWNKIDDAANYIVVIYKKVSIFNRIDYYELAKYDIDRNTHYFAIDKLIGNDYVFKLYAENRNGEIIAECRGIPVDRREPVFFEEVY